MRRMLERMIKKKLQICKLPCESQGCLLPRWSGERPERLRTRSEFARAARDHHGRGAGADGADPRAGGERNPPRRGGQSEFVRTRPPAADAKAEREVEPPSIKREANRIGNGNGNAIQGRSKSLFPKAQTAGPQAMCPRCFVPGLTRRRDGWHFCLNLNPNLRSHRDGE